MTKSSRSRNGVRDTTKLISHNTNNDTQVKLPRFKKMKPRVGGQYQTKVPKFSFQPVSKYQPIRPKPERISIHHNPSHINEFYIQEKEEKQESYDSQLESDEQPWLDSRIPTRSGGTCVHREALKSQANHFIQYTQSILSRKPEWLSPSSDNYYESVFCQDMISNYGNASSGTRHRKKRRVSSEWTSCSSLIRRCNTELPPREEDELLFLYFSSKTADTVELDLRVKLSNGTACKARRILKKTRHSNRFKQPSFQLSASWRLRLERTTFWGDLRSGAAIMAHPYSVNNEFKCSRVIDSTATAGSVEDMKGVWRSILAYGQAMERAMNNNNNDTTGKSIKNNRPRRIEVMNFVRNVFALTLPEETFGSRHVCVEEISMCMHKLLDNLSVANDALAEIIDFLADNANGVDMESLRKLLDKLLHSCPMKLDEEVVLRKQIEDSVKWQEKMDALISNNSDHEWGKDIPDPLQNAANLLKQAYSQLYIRTSGVAAMEKKLQKAEQLEEKIIKMGDGMTVKSIAALVREANRINIPSRRVRELRIFHKELDCWVERANIAIRSRLSLPEIEALILRAKTMPLNLNEFLDKLNSRVRMGRSWVTRLENEVPRVYKEDGCTTDEIIWMDRMRQALADDKKGGTYGILQELCSEGVRVPVEMICMKLLQIEIDAKNWMTKAKKWLPSVGEAAKKPKIEELKEHLSKADNLRDRIPFAPKESWKLDYEEELRSTVEAAENWYTEHRPFIDFDNRRNSGRSCLSLEKLRGIVNQGTALHVNIGNSIAKMCRVLEQAEVWFEANKLLLVRANVLGLHKRKNVDHSVTLSELTDAISSASTNVSVDLEEALALQKIAEQIQSWLERVCNAAPIKRSKRVGKGRWSCKSTRFSMNDLVDLIEEAKSLPIPTNEEVLRLKTQLKEIQAWRLKVHSDFKNIAVAFCGLRSLIESIHGPSDSFYSSESVSCVEKNSDKPEITNNDPRLTHARNCMENEAGHSEQNAAHVDTSANRVIFISNRHLGSNNEVARLVSSLLYEARQTGVVTAEEGLLKNLDNISTWCCKSIKALDSKSDLFEKKAAQNFNILLNTGRNLLQLPDTDPAEIDISISQMLRKSWSLLVDEQLTRLEKLAAQRNEFIKWSKSAHSIITAKEKKITIDVLNDLIEHSRKYPSSTDIVQKVQSLFQRISEWQEKVKTQLYSKEKRMNIQQAKALCEEGDKLKLVCQELKVLRNALRSSRSWLNRLKKYKTEQQNGICASKAEKLMSEHDDLLVVMPEEVECLKQAMKGYCICRRPYEGFMIGCDSCDEWYHGPCIGVSETQADRFEKYLCVRCCVKKVFKSSSLIIAGIVKKWTCDKGRKKARQSQYQKHQRKVRKERKDIEKFESQISKFRDELHQIKLKESKNTGVTSSLCIIDPGYDNLRPNLSETDDTDTGPANLFEDERIINPRDDKNNEFLVARELVDSQICSQFEKNTAEALNNTKGEMKIGYIIANNSDLTQKATNRRKEVESEILDLEQAIYGCNKRLHCLHMKATERSEMDKEEDRFSKQLKVWCIRVRSTILVPSTTHRAELSKPLSHGRLSQPMKDIFRDAEFLGISRFSDVKLVANSLECICWSSFVMTTLKKKPTLKEVQHLLNLSSKIDLPDEKAIRMLKSMVQRTAQWQSKVRKCLLPKPGERKPFSLEVLKSVYALHSCIPFEVPESVFLTHAIEDRGIRYCLCGGANDGTFMLSCDKCEQWFHGRCVNIDKVTGSSLDNWTCPLCTKGEGASEFKLDLEKWFDFVDEDDNNSTSNETDYAPAAPTIEKMWPPFKLSGSEESREVLGETCISIPDEAGYIAELDDIRADSPFSAYNAQRISNERQSKTAESNKVDTKYGEERKMREGMNDLPVHTSSVSNSCEEVNHTESLKLPIMMEKQLPPNLKMQRALIPLSTLFVPPPKRRKHRGEDGISLILQSTKVATMDTSPAQCGLPIAKGIKKKQNPIHGFNKSGNIVNLRQYNVDTYFRNYPIKDPVEQGVRDISSIHEETERETVHSGVTKNELKEALPENCLHLNAQITTTNHSIKTYDIEQSNPEKLKGSGKGNMFIVPPELNGNNETQVLETENEILRVSCKG